MMAGKPNHVFNIDRKKGKKEKSKTIIPTSKQIAIILYSIDTTFMAWVNSVDLDQPAESVPSDQDLTLFAFRSFGYF
jgi:hypothetical protein